MEAISSDTVNTLVSGTGEIEHKRFWMRAVAPSMKPSLKADLYSLLKRFLDVLVTSVALGMLFPVFATVAFLIWLEDRGPVLYRQSRIGQGGNSFWFYKFRSMRPDADQIRETLLAQSDVQGVAFKMKQDPRITCIGRFIRKRSIDELPQLFSVLVGQMSIVGPRPHLASEVATYTEHQRVRLSVKPGLLCLREVKGRSHLSFDEWLALDLEYVQKRNLALDLKIMLLAIPAILRGEGAY